MAGEGGGGGRGNAIGEDTLKQSLLLSSHLNPRCMYLQEIPWCENRPEYMNFNDHIQMISKTVYFGISAIRPSCKSSLHLTRSDATLIVTERPFPETSTITDSQIITSSNYDANLENLFHSLYWNKLSNNSRSWS